MNPHDQAIIHSSSESDWRTPDACFAALHQEFRFDLDAAADAASTKVPQAWFGPGSPLAENALVTPWDYAGWGTRVFLNPPFSRQKIREFRRAGRHDQARVYDIAEWAAKCWHESQKGSTIVGLFPFAPQTAWYRAYVYGHTQDGNWGGHAALQERRLPHRISFDRPDGGESANAGVNTAVIVWGPARGIVGPWTPWTCYWSWK